MWFNITQDAVKCHSIVLYCNNYVTPAFNYSVNTLWAWKLESKIVAKWIPKPIREVLLPQTFDLIGLQSWLTDISLLFITISCYFYFQKIDSYKVVDRLTQEYGHELLRLPPYHSAILNPIEQMWALTKELYCRSQWWSNHELCK